MAKRNNLLIVILTIGTFGIINTEMGIIGILPSIANHFDVSVSKAGLLVSVFALTVSICGLIMPLLFSGVNRKKAMLLVLGIFILSNIVSLFATNFTIAVLARVIPAIFHPIYFSAAFTVAANLVHKEEAPKAVAKVLMGVSAGMVLGVPIASLLASTVSLQVAMLFFAIVNALVFIATLVFFPSMPVKERLSYGAQVSVLKKTPTWLSIVTVLLINSAIFGVYSYLAEYLRTITNISGKSISVMLVLFGGANIIGNIVAGKLLTKDAIKSIVSFPFVLGVVYIILFLIGQFTLPMAIMTLVWGILAGIGNNINQYWITSAAPEAPDFANGLFVTSANLGTTMGTAVGGLFISGLGTQYILLVGVLSLLLSLPFILLRNYMYNPIKQLSK
ncbi:MFS transporter [Priestia filamentosa]|uniref:MFS transporter n=1 Tax=Priestia filamentosa TaxID=1402861 RepID=UPI001FB1F319|nr:MFS transporter [Priestia filamentosa]MED3728775.1 MFS transporter [Priestia filamentosa]UOE58520.1 MFS transporter [Priestia filamentosa]